MNRGLQWIVGISVALIALTVIASTVLPFFAPQAGWGGWAGMMGPNHMFGGRATMGGFGMMPFLGLGMLLGPLLVVGLIVVGVLWLARSLTPPVAPRLPAASAAEACRHCGSPLQAGWKACPYCGEKVV